MTLLFQKTRANWNSNFSQLISHFLSFYPTLVCNDTRLAYRPLDAFFLDLMLVLILFCRNLVPVMVNGDDRRVPRLRS